MKTMMLDAELLFLSCFCSPLLAGGKVTPGGEGGRGGVTEVIAGVIKKTVVNNSAVRALHIVPYDK